MDHLAGIPQLARIAMTIRVRGVRMCVIVCAAGAQQQPAAGSSMRCNRSKDWTDHTGFRLTGLIGHALPPLAAHPRTAVRLALAQGALHPLACPPPLTCQSHILNAYDWIMIHLCKSVRWSQRRQAAQRLQPPCQFARVLAVDTGPLHFSCVLLANRCSLVMIRHLWQTSHLQPCLLTKLMTGL